MDLTVTYIHHNCFCVGLGNKTLVFDFPGPAHRPPQAAQRVRAALAGREAVVFFSHSHADHCSADIVELVRGAASVSYVLSFDVPDMVPELDLPEAVVLEPDDDPAGGVPGPAMEVNGITASALESNDLGVAFFIRVGGLKLYYGGDLAEWLWPGTDDAGQAHTRAFFSRSLDAIAAFAPDLAFTDCDLRLPNRAGFERFARTVRPTVLVPMHDFGDPQGVARAAAEVQVRGTSILTHAASGDSTRLDLPAA